MTKTHTENPEVAKAVMNLKACKIMFEPQADKALVIPPARSVQGLVVRSLETLICNLPGNPKIAGRLQDSPIPIIDDMLLCAPLSLEKQALEHFGIIPTEKEMQKPGFLDRVMTGVEAGFMGPKVGRG